MLLETHRAEIETILSRYDSRRSAVLPLLYLAQDTYGYLTEAAIREVAAILGLPPTDVFEVVGFYTLFYNRPVGTWVLQVCDDVPCCYLGAEELISALKQSLGVCQRGQRAGHTAQQGGRLHCAIGILLRSFDALPVAQHILRPVDLHIGEDMRVAAHKLAAYTRQHIAQVKLPTLGSDLGMDHHLHQQIAQLLAQIQPVAAVQGFEHLIGLLENAGLQRLMRLFPIPRATTGGTQASRDLA